MLIAAVGDIHCPRFLPEFERSLNEIQKPDVFLLTGDIVNRGKSDEYPVVIDAIESIHGQIPIIACFGNEDYNQLYHEQPIIDLVGNRVTFLDNSKISLTIRGFSIGIIGVSIIKESAKDIGAIRAIFEERARMISEFLLELSTDSDYAVILSHYCPLEETESNNPKFSWWFEKAMRDVRPAMILHGHIHNPTKNRVVVESTPVYNVALPAVGSITELEIRN